MKREITSPIVKHTATDERERIIEKIQGTPKLSTEVISYSKIVTLI